MQAPPKLSVLVLYDPGSLYTNFVRDHLESFALHLPHDVHYAAATHDRPLTFSFDMFDVVAVHFTVRLAYRWHLAPAYAEALAAFRGLKILFIQDEYDSPQVACEWIKRLGIHVVFTCVHEPDREAFYPRQQVGDVEFRPNLTGYVAERLEHLDAPPEMAQREIYVGYRGRVLPFWYGRLAREKLTIGVRMQELCQRHSIPCDIAWDEGRRLYGAAWERFLENCRTTLGTESGSNVVDRDGSLRRQIEAELRRNPRLTFDEAFERYLRPHEGRVAMNQVPPKVFEAIAHRTVLVLFEGAYSGVVQPGTHYIELKKDFSNAAEVLDMVRDARFLEDLAERAHRDVIGSGRYRYAVLMAVVDEVLRRWAAPAGTRELVHALVACRCGAQQWAPSVTRDPLDSPITSIRIAEFEAYRGRYGPPEQSAPPLLSGKTARLWYAVPTFIRRPVRYVLRPALAWLLRRAHARGSQGGGREVA